MATSKKPTAKQKEELVQTLKFTPRTYTVRINGYGGEIAMGSIKPATVDYFKKHFIDVENYSYNCAEEGDDEYIAVPEALQPFTQGNWWDCDGIEHSSGAEFGGSWLIIEDENGNEVLETELGYNLEDDGCEIECYCDEEIDEYCDDETAVFVGQNFEKGCFFEGELELTQPFDISKFKFTYSEVAGWRVLSTVEYDGEEIEGSDGYSTTGKSSSFNFYYRDSDGDVAEYSSPEYPAYQDCSGYYADDWEKVDFKFNKTNRPVLKGWYECVWKSWGTSYGKLFWDGENWIEYDYGKPTTVTGVERWSGLIWDTLDEANKPAKKPRKKKDAAPIKARDVHPWPHELNGQWPDDLSMPEVADELDSAFTSFVNAVEAEVKAQEESWISTSIKPPAKGRYECEFETAQWPMGKVRGADWTGRSWKEDGKKADVLRWRRFEDDMPVLDGEEMWASEAIDTHSRSWNLADQTPAVPGVYEVKEGGDWPFATYARWNGKVWLEQKNTREDAEKSRKKTHHLHEWREVDR